MTDRVVLKEFEVLNCSTEPDFFGGPDKVKIRSANLLFNAV